MLGVKQPRTSGKQIKYVLKNGESITTSDLKLVDDLITVEVYEGYRKLGRFKLGDARLKFK